MGKETKEDSKTKAQKDKGNTKDKRKAKAEDGQQTIAIWGYQGLKPNHDSPTRNTYTQNSNQIKGKGKWKGNGKGKPNGDKGKGKGRGKGKQGFRNERKEEPTMTNNSQKSVRRPTIGRRR